MKLDRIEWLAAVVFLCLVIGGVIGFAQEKTIDAVCGFPTSVVKESEQSSPRSIENSHPEDIATKSPVDSPEQAQRRTDEAFISRIADAMNELTDATSAVARSEQLWKNDEISNEQLERSRLNLQSVDLNYQRLMDDYRTTMRDILSQTTQAIADLDAAERWLGRVEAIKSRVAVPVKTVDGARHRLNQATLVIERLQSRYEFFAAAVLPDEAIRDAFARVGQFDAHGWGLRFASTTVKQGDGLTKTKYRGGMRILAVTPESPAAMNGIQANDTLVVLDKWETLRPDNVTWVVRRLREQPENGDAQQKVKFYIVRSGEVKFGFLPMPSEARQHTMED